MKVRKQLVGPILSGIGQNATSYTGQQVAPLVSGFNDVQSLINSFSQNGANTQFQGGQQAAINRALSGQPSFDLSPQTTTDYFNKGVLNPMLRSFDQDIAPRIKASFANPGGGGLFSSRAGLAQSRALSDIGVSAQQSLSQAQFQNQGLMAQLSESAANRQLQGVSAANNYAIQPLAQSEALVNALNPFQQQAQGQASAAYNEFQRTQPYSSPYLSNALNFMGINSQQSSFLQPSQLSQLLGLGAGGAGLLNSAFAGSNGSGGLANLLAGAGGLAGAAGGMFASAGGAGAIAGSAGAADAAGSGIASLLPLLAMA